MSDTLSWRPQASIGVLKKRAAILDNIREFFRARAVLEVDVPCIGEFSVTDPQLEALELEIGDRAHFLQTSPEYFMKRLLAAGSGDIYYLGKAFRADECGRIHNHEFAMLEWYRLGLNHYRLIDEVIELVQYIKPDLPSSKYRYSELFKLHCPLDPHTSKTEALIAFCRESLGVHFDLDTRSDWLDLIFTHCVEPALPKGLVAVIDYPSCQSALARLHENENGTTVAARFECYLDGVELANGYWELSDSKEQRERFMRDNEIRRKTGKPQKIGDPMLLGAVEAGLPDCAGVALGIDRLVMSLLQLDSIAQQRSF